jgi:hypothetical protein
MSETTTRTRSEIRTLKEGKTTLRPLIKRNDFLAQLPEIIFIVTVVVVHIQTFQNVYSHVDL